MMLLTLWSLASLALALPQVPGAKGESTQSGELLPATAFGPGLVESMDAMLERARARSAAADGVARERNGAQGRWIVPPRGEATRAHSGTRYLTNRWGDRRMGIAFPQPVEVEGAWVAGQASPGAWAPALRAVGYRAGREVGRTPWFDDVDETPSWFPIELAGVDRIEIHARHAVQGAAWYALDDLTFRVDVGGERTVLDFEDLDFRTDLSESDYAGLTWEIGTGDFTPEVTVIPAPRVASGARANQAPPDPDSAALEAGSGSGGTAPSLVRTIPGVRMFEAGTSAIPPDTCGAAGPVHFVSIVNGKLTAFDKQTGARALDIPLVDFWSAPNLGDPRVIFDPHSQRFFALCSSGPTTARIYVAISLSSDPTGDWYKTFFEAAQGSDVGRWPDYPTLGVDAHGFYGAALMVGNGDPMTIWAIDKAPLLDPQPALGAVSAWREQPFQGAIQPCVTFGAPRGEYLVSRRFDGTALRVRRIDGPLDAPTMTTLGPIATAQSFTAADAPALGAAVDISTLDTRPMNAVFRDGSIWTAHTVAQAGRAACRWYELDPVLLSVVQTGTVADPVWHYYFPSISVNAGGDVAMGFSGSHAAEYVSSFYTGRRPADPAGEMGPPVLLRAGAGSYQHLDGNGTNRWGDYSLTTIDPVDDVSFWTIQEYARVNNRWGTWIGLLQFDPCQGATVNTCVAAANSAGAGALLSSSGSTSIAANDLVLEAVDVPANKPGLFYYGGAAIQVPFGDGFRCVGSGTGGVYRLNPLAHSDGAGRATRALDLGLSPWITPASTWTYQFWFRDPTGPGGSGFNLTDGLSVTFCR